MNWYRMIAAGLSLALLAGCAGGTQAAKSLTPSTGGSAAVEPKLVPEADRALGNFGGKLLSQVRKEGENTLVSPLSVLLCLSMCANGAEGEALQEFLDTLGGGTDLDGLNANCASLMEDYLRLGGSTQCSIAGGLWADERLRVNEDFLQRCADIYRSGAYQADLDTQQTMEQVNAWVNKQTRGVIGRILDQPPSSDTVLLLLNALYLKNTWRHEFDPNDTYTRSFYPASGGEQTTDFLHNGVRTERYFSTEVGRGVILPYDDGRLAFFTLLPEGGDLSGCLAGWDAETLPGLLDAAEDTMLSLSIPKFEAEWGGSLVDALQALGLTAPFDPQGGGLSGMGTADGSLTLSDVVHKTRIEVNEKGTEAAAVTMAMVAECAMAMDEPEYLVLERPFLYGIVDLERQVPVFLGSFETAE
mgnify:CR=1 FL=1